MESRIRTVSVRGAHPTGRVLAAGAGRERDRGREFESELSEGAERRAGDAPVREGEERAPHLHLGPPSDDAPGRHLDLTA